MAFPTVPTIDYSYTAFQQAQGKNEFPGTQLDNDLANLADGLGEVRAFLEQSFRSDGGVLPGALPTTGELTAYGNDLADIYEATVAAKDEAVAAAESAVSATEGKADVATTLAGYGITDAAPLSHVGSGGTAHALATTSAHGFLASTDKAKLDGVASGATANSSDATLLARANHTGTQAISTVTDLQTTLGAKAPLSHVGSGGAAHADATTSASGFMPATDKAKADALSMPAVTAGAALTAAGYGLKLGRNTTATGPDLIASAFPSYDAFDGSRVVAELPLGSTIIQVNGQSVFAKTSAANISPGYGGLAVDYFGAAVVAGDGLSTTSRTGGWFGNGALLDDATPGNYYSSTKYRALAGHEMDFYVYHDDTLVTGYVAVGNSRVKPSSSLAFVAGNLSQVQYWTGNTTSGSTTVSGLSAPSSMWAGMHIAGSGIPANSHVVSINVGAATCVINNAATATATGVLLDSSIPWDYSFVSQDGAATNALIVGKIDGHPSQTNSYSQYVIFSSRASGVNKTTTLQTAPDGQLMVSSAFTVGAQTPGGAASYSNYLRLVYGTGSGAGEAWLQSDTTGLIMTSGPLSVNSSYLLATRTTLYNGAASSTATLTNAPASGNPTKWFQINDNGTVRYVPAW